MHRIDASTGGKDLHKYQLGTLKQGSAVYENVASDQRGTTSRDVMVAIKSTVQSPNGTYYEIVSVYSSVYVEASSVNLVSSY